MHLFTTFMQVAQDKVDESRGVWKQAMTEYPLGHQEEKIGARFSSIRFDDAGPLEITKTADSQAYLTATFVEQSSAYNLFLNLQSDTFIKGSRLAVGFYEQGIPLVTMS
jgi:hypothetical protein